MYNIHVYVSITFLDVAACHDHTTGASRPSRPARPLESRDELKMVVGPDDSADIGYCKPWRN
jgi:hypothetical protein